MIVFIKTPYLRERNSSLYYIIVLLYRLLDIYMIFEYNVCVRDYRENETGHIISKVTIFLLNFCNTA